MMDNKSFVFRFADIEVHEREFRLIKAGEALAVEPKAFRVLLFLLRNPQKVVRKEELLDAVWGDTAVSENSLARSIALLRRLLGDDAHEQRFIATVATVGYRFIAPVEVSEDGRALFEAPGKPGLSGEQEASESLAEPLPVSVGVQRPTPIAVEAKGNGQVKTDKGSSAGNKSRRWLAVSVAVLIVCMAAASWYLLRPRSTPRITDYTLITHDGQTKDLVGTDGSRLYFNQVQTFSIAQVAASGGEVGEVPVQLRTPSVVAVSPDGATLLVRTGDDGYLWSVGVLGNSLQRLVGDSVLSAAFSPDGRFIVYSNVGGDLYRIRSDGSNPQKLIHDPDGFGFLAWSPDGSTIRFTAADGLWQMSAAGLNRHRLLLGWAASTGQCCGSWTPDGRFFIFLSGGANASYATPPPFDQIWALDERNGIFRKPASLPVQLTSGPIRWGGAVASRDGTRIYARGVTQRGELVRLDSTTHQLQPFLGGISAESVTFSPDGKLVAYVTFPDGILWKANRDGSGKVQLTNSSVRPGSARWSPDGGQILLDMRDPQGLNSHLYVVPSQGGEARRLPTEEDRSQFDGGWSADGRKIVYSSISRKSTKPEDDWRLCVLGLESGQITDLPGSTGLFSPRWSPDGRSIAAMTWDSNNIRLFDIGTQKWSSLLQQKDLGFPTWSHDSRYIYMLSPFTGHAIFRVPASGGKAERVVDLTGFRHTGSVDFWMGLDPNDAPLLLRDVGTDDLYALTLEDK